ncbi:hypothetical protein D1B31_22105 [Neobacillus notoginsengisoli]|uniref:Uncharacterized protein n=2 Tax=Neobacillus notoginsengisoli TaxID=1578198 RepID=A0A417YFH3_9BACI|nr:hypothetical protein D1B31_22105 [Neobacillus notoginsengisoli]
MGKLSKQDLHTFLNCTRAFKAMVENRTSSNGSDDEIEAFKNHVRIVNTVHVPTLLKVAARKSL